MHANMINWLLTKVQKQLSGDIIFSINGPREPYAKK